MRDETVGSHRAGSPESTSSHQSSWQEEQILLRESCFWRLLNCSWHCSESFNSLENPRHFNIARILAHRMTEPHHGMGSSLRGASPWRGHFVGFIMSRGKDGGTEPGSSLHEVSQPWGSVDTEYPGGSLHHKPPSPLQHWWVSSDPGSTPASSSHPEQLRPPPMLTLAVTAMVLPWALSPVLICCSPFPLAWGKMPLCHLFLSFLLF